MAGSEHPGRKIRFWLTGRFGEMRLAGMGTYADLSIMWIEDTKRAPIAVEQRRARISMDESDITRNMSVSDEKAAKRQL